MQWKSTDEIHGFYEVSEQGHVRCVKRGKGCRVGAVRTPAVDPRTGYLRLTLKINRRSIGRDVHRLVAEAFLGPCPRGYEVNHKDGNRTNPCLSNLEYVTRAENAQHTHRKQRQKPKGTSRANKHLCVLSDREVRDIRRLVEDQPEISRTALAHKYKVSKATITNVVNRITYNRL